jgi:hypothetical protein
MKASLVRGVTLLGAALLVPFASLPAAAAASAPPTSVPSGSWSLHAISSAPRLPIGTRALGALAPSTTISGAVALQPSNDAQLQQFIATVTEKGSPSFHHYLAPGTFRDRFGPSPAAIADVERSIDAGGLKVTGVAHDGLLVSFSGSAAHASETFHTGFNRYRLESGAIGRGTTGAASLRLPSSIAHEVVGIVGLDQLVQAMPAGLVRGSAAAHARFPSARAPHVADAPGAPSACTAAEQDAETYGGLTDNSIANAYGADGLYRSGDVATGQHVAVYELEAFSPSDIEGFDTCYFGATEAALMSGTGGNIAGSQLSIVPVDGGQPPGSGSGESLLDIEDVSGMAPGANIDVYEAPNTTIGGLDEYSAIINNDADQVVTSSWGVCEQLAQSVEPGLQEAENVLFQQAAAQGQTVLSAEGDTGSDSCNEYRYTAPPSGQNVLSVLDPASQPYVVSVGGTTIDAATQPPSEHVWNDGAEWGAGGGGISESWAMPSWQQPVALGAANTAEVSAAETLESETAGTAAPFGTPTFCDGTLGLPANTPCRETPDVSAQADEFTGAVTVYSGGQWFTIGGTSSATPIWAAMLALVNASPGTGCSSDLVNGVPDVGFASPILYGIAASPAAYAASFNDITSGNNDIYGLTDGTTFQANTGYDMASGLGSPQLTSPSGGIGLAYYMCSYGASAEPPIVTGLSPSVGRSPGGNTVIVTGSGFGTSGTPLVAGVEVGSAAATSFSVVNNTTLDVVVPPALATVPPGSPNPTQDGAGPAQIVVVLNDGESSSPSASSTYEYVDTSGHENAPSVTSVSPYGGLDTAPATVTVYGAGFSGVTSVDFGGVAGTNVTVVSPYELTVTPPLLSSLTPASACPMDSGASDQPLNPTQDICQVEVTVSAGPTSAQATILPPYEGPISFNNMGGEIVPSGCDCEIEPQTTEYDYVPAPTVTSVSTGTVADLPYNAAQLASEFGGAPSNVVTVTGTGLDPLTFDYGYFGTPGNEEGMYYPIEESGTSIVLDAPAIAGFGGASIEPANLPVGVTTLGGTSPASANAAVTYAGVPEVDTVTNTNSHHSLDGSYGSVDTGGAPLDIAGAGFLQTVGPIEFPDVATPYSLGTQYVYSVNSDTDVTTSTVSQNPAVVSIGVCSNTGCSSQDQPGSLLILYPPGAPSVTSLSPSSGTPLGGTGVDIRGRNLGCVVSVSFGSKVASTFSATEAILDCGQTGLVTAKSPVGTPASKVKVTVATVESILSGPAPTSNASFTYTGKAGSPGISTAGTVTATVGKHFSFSLKATGSGTTTWKATGALPHGVTFKPSTGGVATLSGTPAAGTGGTYYPTFTATDHDGSLAQPFTLRVTQKPAISTASMWTITEGTPARDVVTATGFPTPTVSLSGALPAGMSAASESNGTLVITGTPQPGTVGTHKVTLHASNSAGSVSESVKIVVKS